MLYYPSHPSAYNNGYIYQHRYVMEQHLGRSLRPFEVVHHKNDKRDDNRIENLELFERQWHHLNRKNPNLIGNMKEKTFKKMCKNLRK